MRALFLPFFWMRATLSAHSRHDKHKAFQGFNIAADSLLSGYGIILIDRGGFG
jgi:hypothetical protein